MRSSLTTSFSNIKCSISGLHGAGAGAREQREHPAADARLRRGDRPPPHARRQVLPAGQGLQGPRAVLLLHGHQQVRSDAVEASGLIANDRAVFAVCT